MDDPVDMTGLMNDPARFSKGSEAERKEQGEVSARFSTECNEGGKPEERRFCGRCQSWLPNAIEIHHCVRAPRVLGYAWHEPDEPAFEKNSILTDGRKFKRGELIKEFHASSAAAIGEASASQSEAEE